MTRRATEGAPDIDGFVFRRFAPEHDYPGITAVLQAQMLADHVSYLPTEASIRNDYDNMAGFDARRDAIVAEVGGRIVAMGAVIRSIRDGATQFTLDAAVHPEWRRRRIGTAILRWQEARAQERLDEEPADGNVALMSWIDDTQVGALALLANAGYRQVRYGFMMLRDLADAIPDVSLPAPLEIRPVREEDHRRIFEAENEAFRDHWNHREQEEVDFVRTFAQPDIDTSLWRIAWDGDEVASVVMNCIYPEENEGLGVRRGWLDRISTRRPWRRRGVASALIVSSFQAFRERGMTDAALGVDSENPNGALGLYVGLGFRRHQTGIAHRKEL
ncbi:MAG: GNAT family N-acetyltransferase [Chloroflexota bacterium]